MLTLMFIYALIYLKIINKQIEDYMRVTGNRAIEINDKGIESIDEEKIVRIKWEDIYRIIINKYTICFVPEEKNSKIFMSISKEYKNEVIEGLKNYKKETLLIDNSNIY